MDGSFTDLAHSSPVPNGTRGALPRCVPRSRAKNTPSRCIARHAVAISFLVGILAAAPRNASAQPATDFYIDLRGQRVEQGPTYDAWVAARRYERNYSRAALENGAIVLIELATYWYEPQSSVVDWQFPDLESKLTSSEAFRFDDNLIRTNFILHPIAGSSHYLFTRVNGFDVASSFGVAAASSALYELVLEWRELVSANDLLVTPFGGMAAGEFFFQLGNYLNSEQPEIETEVRGNAGSIARGGARSTLGFPRMIHNAMDGPEQLPRVAIDNLGLSSAYGHSFRLRLGQESLFDEHGNLGELLRVSGEFEIAAMPGFLRPGRFQRFFANGNFSSFELVVGSGDGGQNTELFFDSHLLGLYGQDLSTSSKGWANEIALASGLRFVDRRQLGESDQYGIVDLPHPSERAWIGLGSAQLELGANASFDFCSIHSAAYDRYALVFGDDGSKSSLVRHGYVHTWGISGELEGAITLGAMEIGGKVRHGHYESIDGLERRQELVTRDSHSRETMTDLRAHLQLEPEGAAVTTRFEVGEIHRGSTLESALGRFRAESVIRTMSVEIGLHF